MTIASGQTILAADINGIKDDVDAILSASTARVATVETTTSTSFTNLSTTGPAVTLTTGTAVLLILTSRIHNNTAGQEGQVSFEVTGASSVSASANIALRLAGTTEQSASFVYLLTGLTAGSNTFTAKYAVSGGTGTFAHRQIGVIPLGD